MSKVKTKVFFEKFGKHPTFSIWNVDEDCNKVGQYPVISFGVKKAEAIMRHAGELEGFIAAQTEGEDL